MMNFVQISSMAAADFKETDVLFGVGKSYFKDCDVV